MWSAEVRVLVQEAAIVSHTNAPLTIEGRRRLVVRIASVLAIAHVAAQLGVSRVTASKWRHRKRTRARPTRRTGRRAPTIALVR